MHALKSWREEKRSAYLYRIVSDTEAGTPRQLLFLELAQAAEEQAALWVLEMRRSGELPETDTYRPDLRTRLVGWMIPHLGVGFMRHILAAMKVRGMSLYRNLGPHGTHTTADFVEKRHAHGGSGSLRAAVFGINDGLVSNASLILGVAGAGAEAGVIILSGVAGLLAGAFSMAAGEYVSMRAQREFYEYQIALEREELDQYPQEEASELALIYTAKGIEEAEARRMADALIRDPEQALDTLAREELGLNPEELGSPWGAAIASFVAFCLGAVLPLLPYFTLKGEYAFQGTLIVTAISLFSVGAAISLFTGKQALVGGLRMLLIGAMAGTATWLIGRALGVALS